MQRAGSRNRLRSEPEGEVEEKIHKLLARNIIQAIQRLYLCNVKNYRRLSTARKSVACVGYWTLSACQAVVRRTAFRLLGTCPNVATRRSHYYGTHGPSSVLTFNLMKKTVKIYSINMR
jgi:hypothetical protein